MLCFCMERRAKQLEPMESELSHLVRNICGLRKNDSVRAVRERYQILSVRELHLKEIFKLLIIFLRNESPLQEIKLIIIFVEFEGIEFEN